jgi:hypothetical protein
MKFENDIGSWERGLRQKTKTDPAPSPIKRYRGGVRVSLPPAHTEGEFTRVLLERRTWRRFATGPVALDDLSTLLGLTFGVRMDGTSYDGRRSIFKTSPSGGACHPYEAYVLALRVDGFAARPIPLRL